MNIKENAPHKARQFDFGGPGRNRTTALGGLILLQDCPFEGQFSLAR